MEPRVTMKSLVPNLRYDLPAGVVVFLVALPLCLGIALASDAPLFSGVISGVIAGLIVSVFSGSELSVSGPAAGLTVIVASGIETLGGFEAFLLAVLISGVMQVILGLIRAGELGSFFPSSVVKGMLAGIGILIILKQIPHALGRDTEYEGDLAFWISTDQENTFTEIARAVISASPGAILITMLSLFILWLWDQPRFKASARYIASVPGPLLVVGLGIALNGVYEIFWSDFHLSAEEGHLVQLPLFTSEAGLLGQFAQPDWSVAWNADVWTVAITIAVVASLETLLSVEATDRLDPFRRTSNLNRELVAQGIGNGLAGLLGGIPMTSVVVRSSANVYAGGRTRLAVFVHGVLLVVCVLLIPEVLNLIPLASLAAILFWVGYKLARVSLFQEMYEQGWEQFVPFMVTILALVFTDLLTGVLVGLAVGVVIVLRVNHHSAIHVKRGSDHIDIEFTKDVSFLNKATIKAILADIPNGASVHVNGRNANFIDRDVLDVFKEFEAGAKYRNIELTFIDMDSEAYGSLFQNLDGKTKHSDSLQSQP